MVTDVHIAYLNIARLRHLPDDARVAGFIDNVPKINALAARSPGFVWRLDDDSAGASSERTYESLWGDPKIIFTLSVWENFQALKHFVGKTVHGAFLRRRAEWFEPFDGPHYVLWHIPAGTIPSIAEANAKLEALHRDGPAPNAFDFEWCGLHNVE